MDVKRDRLGLLLGRVDEELSLLPTLPLRYARHGRAQNVKQLFGQGSDVNRQAVPIWRKKYI